MTEQVAAAGYALAAAAYLGFQLTVRFVVYPQFARVPAAAFPAYERAHQRLVTPVVGLLFGALAVGAAALLLTGPRAAGAVAALLFAALLGVTGFGAVPQHTALGRAFDTGTHRRLLRWDAARVVLAAGQVATGIAALVAVHS